MANKFKDNLKSTRNDAKLTRIEISQKLDVTYSTYSNYENGNREPNLSMLVKISEVLGVSIDKLLK